MPIRNFQKIPFSELGDHIGEEAKVTSRRTDGRLVAHSGYIDNQAMLDINPKVPEPTGAHIHVFVLMHYDRTQGGIVIQPDYSIYLVLE